MNRQPLFILTVCFILGIFLQDRYLLENTFIYFTIISCAGILISLFLHSYFLSKVKPYLLGILFFCLGIIFHFFNTFSPDYGIDLKEKQDIVFSVSQQLNSTEKYRKYEGAVQAGNKSFHAIIYIPRNSIEADFKHYYKARANIVQVKPPKYDFQFDYAGYLRRKNIEYQCYLSGDLSHADKPNLSFGDVIRQQRLEVLQNIDNTRMSEGTKAFLKGIILADRTEIDMGVLEDFNKTGLVHLLAISGTHIMVIFGMFYFLLVRFIHLDLRKYAIIVSLVFIWFFAMFIGFGNSVLRSCIMLSAYFIYIMLQRKPDLLHSLALSALIILFFDTHQLFDVGFQLSFLAVLGIFWLNQPLLKLFPRQDHYLKKLIFNTITISVSAQLATLPVVLYYFHQFSFISVIANFVIVPFSEIIIVFSFLVTILAAFQINLEYIYTIYDTTIQFLLKTIHWFGKVDMLFFENIPMNLPEVVTILGVVFLFRSFILSINFKNFMELLISVVLFLIVRIGSDIIENQKDEVVFHHFNKYQVLLVKKGNKVCFWVPEKAEQKKITRYVINPYCSSRRISDYEIKTYSSSVRKIVFQEQVYDLK